MGSYSDVRLKDVHSVFLTAPPPEILPVNRLLDSWASRLCLLALPVLCCLGCGKEQDDRPNLILISIDTLRADHLGCYGYGRATSPNLDAFAASAVLYERAVAPAPWTLPSHVAMLTGRDPLQSGILDRLSAIPEEVPVVAELLQKRGYQSAAFVDSNDGGFVGARRGFARGFATYNHSPHPGERFDHDMAATVDAGIAWMEQSGGDGPFFLFLHTKSVHSTMEVGKVPYSKPEPYQSRFLEQPGGLLRWRGVPTMSGSQQLNELNTKLAAGHREDPHVTPESVAELIALYDAGIYYVDEQFQRLLDYLADSGLQEETIVMVVSDHGEMFTDHLFFGHTEVYEPALRVPLLLREPGGPAGQRIKSQVRLADLFSTLLERAGVESPRGVVGRPLPLGERSAEASSPEFGYFLLGDNSLYEAYSLRQGAWKLIRHRLTGEAQFRADLFHIDEDPGERRPVAGEEDRRKRMRARLLEWIAEGESANSKSIDLLDEELEQLSKLGYLSPQPKKEDSEEKDD